ncbi:6,7-dimethyl-8-ribityllumazine synthase [Pyrobaculum islandicum DSM 4184]|uniref:6,7-dimethyl-8-ribityllumazine synthase n=2 Tax=Pyrobaculum islandicum TaxID=2277 RepID=A1RRZ7_PYRIL|nr:6,7-dimethyl-8-ribityllumazine synthase [Pyrobaculum islandicum DSM 4184]
MVLYRSYMVKLALVVAEFNYDITQLMLQKALEHAKFLGAEVTYVVKVPGVFDIPMVLKELASKNDVDAIATLGAVIQGATKHDEIVATQAARKILDIAVEVDKPITLGIIGHGANRIQALERVEEYARRAVEAAVKLARRKRALKEAKYTGSTVYID